MNLFGASPKPGFIESFKSTWETPRGKVIVLANLVPAAGLLAFGWDVYAVAFLYWLENVVIGVFQVLKMVLASGSPVPALRGFGMQGSIHAPSIGPITRPTSVLKLFLIPFFLVHYGGFCFGHGMFVAAIFGSGLQKGQSLAMRFPPDLGLAVIALVAMHGFLFVKDYLIEGEWQSASVIQLMQEPYGRIVLLHLFIIGGAFAVMALKMSPNVLLAVVLLKTGWDCRSDAARRIITGPPPLAVPAS